MTDITIERMYVTAAERVWELWTTPVGIEQSWGPDGFQARWQSSSWRWAASCTTR